MNIKNINKSLSLLVNARIDSTRLPNKVILPFCNTTLIDIALNKLAKIENVKTKYLAVYDDILKDKLNNYNNISLIERNKDSVEKGNMDIKIRFNFFKYIESDYVMLINCCCPMTSIDTINNAINFFYETNFKSYTSIVKINDWIYYDKEWINKKNYKNISTDEEENIQTYKASHNFHIINVKRFLDEGIIWKYDSTDPIGIKIPNHEYLDIDTKEDFEYSKIIYRGYNNGF